MKYPLWRALLIGLVALLALIYALPNGFGEEPALQVYPTRGVKLDNNSLNELSQPLKAAGVSFHHLALSGRGIELRFASTETQLRAKGLLETALGERYVVALAMVSRSPDWLKKINALPMYLGLDLRGGVYFLLKIDAEQALTQRYQKTEIELKRLLRDKGWTQAALNTSGAGRWTLALPQQQHAAAIEAIGRQLEQLSASSQGNMLMLELNTEASKKLMEDALAQNLVALRNRVNELGVSEPVIQRQGADRIAVQLPGIQDTARAKDILGRTATLQVRMVDETDSPGIGSELLYERRGEPVVVKKTPVLTGENITDAQPGFDSQTNEPAVHVDLDAIGARVFREVTAANVGRRMAIVLVENRQAEVITAPVIRSEIGGGRVQITGSMDLREAQDIALLMRSGSLAAPMKIIEERTVGPSLGQENISRGVHSTWYGFIAIALFIGTYYAVFGVVSVLSLAFNLVLLVAALSVLQATMTLPGIAGLALTLGIAIDANVLINERIREELRQGLGPHAAIRAGYERAFATILDSNVTQLIAGFALFAFGSGPVRGFAVVLCLGLLTSMFSSVVFSRYLIHLVYGRKARITKLSIG